MKTKTFFLPVAIILLLEVSCMAPEQSDTAKPDFGIHKVLQNSEISRSLIDTLTKLNVIIEEDSSVPFVGYIPAGDTLAPGMDFSGQGITFARTTGPVDDGNEYYGLAAISPIPFINDSDIQNTVPSGNNVEIRFNMEGARKWAEMTAENTGRYVAFIINGEIYSIPMVNAGIRSGVALINGLDSENEAIEISERLNEK